MSADPKTRDEVRQRVLDLTVREGPSYGNRWNFDTLTFEEEQAEVPGGGPVTLREGSVIIWVHFDDFTHWGDRKSAY